MFNKHLFIVLMFLVIFLACDNKNKDIKYENQPLYIYEEIKPVELIKEPIVEEKMESDIENRLKKMGLVNVSDLDSSIIIDVKYASIDNFMGENVYGDFDKCYLQSEIASKLILAQKLLKEINPNYTLILFDCARPLSIQYKMWNMLEGTDKQKYVANPKIGSVHNYGCAVDLSIYDLKNEKELDMGTPYDFLNILSQPKYEDDFLEQGLLTKEHIENRKLLRNIMINSGFNYIRSEWWHFDGVELSVAKEKYNVVE